MVGLARGAFRRLGSGCEERERSRESGPRGAQLAAAYIGLPALPAHWTDAAPVDPFVVIAAGRAYVRLDDLRQLRALLDGLVAVAPAPEGRSTC